MEWEYRLPATQHAEPSSPHTRTALSPRPRGNRGGAGPGTCASRSRTGRQSQRAGTRGFRTSSLPVMGHSSACGALHARSPPGTPGPAAARSPADVGEHGEGPMDAEAVFTMRRYGDRGLEQSSTTGVGAPQELSETTVSPKTAKGVTADTVRSDRKCAGVSARLRAIAPNNTTGMPCRRDGSPADRPTIRGQPTMDRTKTSQPTTKAPARMTQKSANKLRSGRNACTLSE